MNINQFPPTILIAVLVGVVMFSWSATVPTRGTTVVTTQGIPDLAWISGHWQTAPGGRARIEEHWTQPTGGSMIGMGRTIANNKTVEFEYLRIEQRTDGIYYVASPNASVPPQTSSSPAFQAGKRSSKTRSTTFPSESSIAKTQTALLRPGSMLVRAPRRSHLSTLHSNSRRLSWLAT
jgi:hypothetical protein